MQNTQSETETKSEDTLLMHFSQKATQEHVSLQVYVGSNFLTP